MSINGAFRTVRGSLRLDMELELPGRGVSAVFGPSGAGKTLLLRLLSGLDRAKDGWLSVNGTPWQDQAGLFVPSHRRAVGFVFQESRLFAHLTVRRNLEYGWRRVPVRDRRVDPAAAAELLGLGPFLDRRIQGLSGGERRRVAIGRALASSPSLLLMDEPLAGLDDRARRDIVDRLGRLQRELSVPLLYVTHALDEVTRLADFLVLVEAGRVLASGPTVDMMPRLDLPLSGGNRAQAILETRVVSYDADYGLTRLGFSGGELTVAQRDLPDGREVRVGILARDVSLALDPPTRTSILNILPATVTEIRSEAEALLVVRLDVGGSTLLARITRRSGEALRLEPGRRVYAQVKAVALLR